MLFTVKYIGTSNKNFTKGKLYQVIQLDEDGDYILYDDNNNMMNEYKSKFEQVK